MEEVLNMHRLPPHEAEDCKGGLARAYVCAQKLDGVYPPCDGLKNGTAFPCLYKPYGGWMRRYAALKGECKEGA